MLRLRSASALERVGAEVVLRQPVAEAVLFPGQPGRFSRDDVLHEEIVRAPELVLIETVIVEGESLQKLILAIEVLDP